VRRVAELGALDEEVFHMRREFTLPGGFANLSDHVRVIDRDGTDLGVMIIAEAQRLAAEQGGELVVVEHDGSKALRIVLVKKAPGA
jgi:hypothetical protein